MNTASNLFFMAAHHRLSQDKPETLMRVQEGCRVASILEVANRAVGSIILHLSAANQVEEEGSASATRSPYSANSCGAKAEWAALMDSKTSSLRYHEQVQAVADRELRDLVEARRPPDERDSRLLK
jgi:hypothetical protein